MKFSDNLYYLRKRDKITQEELADRLGVSRQSVSKWETGEAYPETDKLIALCDMFAVSLDALVRGDVTGGEREENTAPTEEPQPFESSAAEDGKECGFGKVMDNFSRRIALGVFLILLGVAVCVALAGTSMYMAEKSARFVSIMSGVAVIFFVAIAVFLFVFSGISYDRFRREHPLVKNVCSETEAKMFARRFAVVMACSVSAILLDVIFLVVFSALIDSAIVRVQNADAAYCFVTAVFMFILSALVGIIVYFGIQHTKYNASEYNSQSECEFGHAHGKFKDPICAAIMLSATALFLVLGFVWNLWHPGWIVFPVGGIACAIVSAFIEAKNKNDKE